MGIRKYVNIFVVALLLIGLLSGCGGESAKDSASFESNDIGEAAPPDSGLAQTGEVPESAANTERKLIRTIDMSVETEDLDQTLEQIDQRIAELSGYAENREIYNGKKGSTRSRYANLTIRIPADKLDQFVNQVSEVSNIISKNETTEDVTLSYVAVESRIKALETEEARLLELLAKAQSMEDLLQIEQRLTEVHSDLETVKSQLRTYDNLVDYGTIQLNISEVREYTEPVEEPEGFWERVVSGFTYSMETVDTMITELTIFALSVIPFFIPPAIVLTVAGVITLVVLWIVRRKKKK